MGTRNIQFENEAYYHIYNRGVDKRKVFTEKNDIWRFVKGVLLFNRLKPIGSIRDELGENLIYSSKATVDFGELTKLSGELVKIVAICLNPNHFHILVKQISDNGISKFMHKLGYGYTRYFNEKNNRSGSLFQGKFKAKFIHNDDILAYVSAYINLNYEIHGIKGDDKNLVFSSWSEYCGENKVLNICDDKNVVLKQFKNKEEYKKFVKNVVKESKESKSRRKKELQETKKEVREVWKEKQKYYLE